MITLEYITHINAYKEVASEINDNESINNRRNQYWVELFLSTFSFLTMSVNVIMEMDSTPNIPVIMGFGAMAMFNGGFVAGTSEAIQICNEKLAIE